MFGAAMDPKSGLVRLKPGPGYAIKAAIADPQASAWTFEAQKTMYGGKHIRTGDVVFLFASENEGGAGLIAKGVVVSAAASPKRPGADRQTPRVSLRIEKTAQAQRLLGRAALKPFADWDDGQPETELSLNSTDKPRTRSSACRLVPWRFCRASWAENL
jgi:hypothetical protein